jgi:hypothetical protein
MCSSILFESNHILPQRSFHHPAVIVADMCDERYAQAFQNNVSGLRKSARKESVRREI